MLAYISWHRPAVGVEQHRYEQALARFHRSLAHQPPSGFRGSASVSLAQLPWLEPIYDAEQALGYEDWYLVDDWSAVGVLEEAAVSRGHLTAHDAAAAQAGAAAGAVYRMIEGCPALTASHGIWVTRALGREHPSLGALLGDGMDPQRDGLWRRCLGLGPAPEFCLLTDESPAGIGHARLPRSWGAQSVERNVVWSG